MLALCIDGLNRPHILDPAIPALLKAVLNSIKTVHIQLILFLQSAFLLVTVAAIAIDTPQFMVLEELLKMLG